MPPEHAVGGQDGVTDMSSERAGMLVIKDRRSLTGCIIVTAMGIFVLFVLGLFFLYVVVGYSFTTREYKSLFYPQDGARIWVNEESYSRYGIVLNVYAPSGVSEVWWPRPRALWDPWLWPWEAHYAPVPFRVIERKDDQRVKLLVDYDFSPGEEWALEIKSKDGYWVTMSPYFPAKPNITEAKWEELVAKSELVVPGDYYGGLEDAY